MGGLLHSNKRCSFYSVFDGSFFLVTTFKEVQVKGSRLENIFLFISKSRGGKLFFQKNTKIDPQFLTVSRNRNTNPFVDPKVGEASILV